MGQRLGHIDAIRAIAAIFVVILHATATRDISSYTKTHGVWLSVAAHFVDLGRIGVIIFFCVSGFVISGSLKEGDTLLSFAIKRFFRLYPIYWISVFIALYVNWHIYSRPISGTLVIDNLTMLTIFTSSEYIQGLYWTLASELIFYCLCAALFAAGLMRSVSLIATLSLFLGLHYLAQLNVFLGPFFGLRDYVLIFKDPRLHTLSMSLSVMFLGATLRAIYEGEATLISKIIVGAACSIYVLFIPLSCYFAYGLTPMSDVVIQTGWSCFLSIVGFLLLTFVLKLTWRPLIAVGCASYSLYLFHGIVLWGMNWYLVYCWPDAQFSVVTLSAAVLSVSILVALITYRFIEIPINGVGRRVATVMPMRLRLPGRRVPRST